jgi:hypothetical protein
VPEKARARNERTERMNSAKNWVQRAVTKNTITLWFGC